MYALFRSVLGIPLPESQPPVRAEQPPVEALEEPIAKPVESQLILNLE